MISEQIVRNLGGTLSPDKNLRLVLVGGTNSGKTSCSFRIAYESAASGGSPLFICNQAKLENKLPLDVRSSDTGTASDKMSADILARIQMKYVTSMNELKAVIAGLHAFSPSPSAVIIDDLSLLIDPLHSVQRNDPKFLEIGFVLAAYIDDVLNFMNTNNAEAGTSTNSRRQLQLIITDSCEESPFLHVLQRTVPNVLKLKKNDSTDTPSYSLVALKGGHHSSARQVEGAVILSKIEHYHNSLLVSR